MATFQQFLGAQGLDLTVGFFSEASADTITAHSGGGQGSATQLVAQINRITTCAAAGDSVLLPTTATVAISPNGPQDTSGMTIWIINSGAKNAAVWPSGTETIDGVNAAITVAPGQIVALHCVTALSWFSGYGVQLPIVVPQVVAAAGATQGGATLITKQKVRVTVTASTEGVKLPVAATGMVVKVMVPGTIGTKVYPNTNAKLDASATNVAVVLAAGKTNIYEATSTTQWITMKSA